MNPNQLFVLEWNVYFAAPQLTVDDLANIPNNILTSYRANMRSSKVICIVRGILLNKRKHSDIFYFKSANIMGKWFCDCISKKGVNNSYHYNMISSCGKCKKKYMP